MNRYRTNYDISWMPRLLTLCIEIQAHADSINEATMKLMERIGNLEEGSASSRTAQSKIDKVKDEIMIRQSDVDRAEAKYLTFREGMMSRMMDAARAGQAIDRDDAGSLIELEITRDLRLEQLTEARKKAEQFTQMKEKADHLIATSLDNCEEISQMSLACAAARNHLDLLMHILDDLSVTDVHIAEQNPNNALASFTKLLEEYSAWNSSNTEDASGNPSLEILKQRMPQRSDLATIDSSHLFSEICIAAATHHTPTKLYIPNQAAFVGDLTEY